MAEGRILVAAESALFDFAGQRVVITQGRTTVREGHPILKGRENLFRPFTVDYDLDAEQPAPAPKGPAAKRPAAAKAASGA